MTIDSWVLLGVVAACLVAYLYAIHRGRAVEVKLRCGDSEFHLGCGAEQAPNPPPEQIERSDQKLLAYVPEVGNSPTAKSEDGAGTGLAP